MLSVLQVAPGTSRLTDISENSAKIHHVLNWIMGIVKSLAHPYTGDLAYTSPQLISDEGRKEGRTEGRKEGREGEREGGREGGRKEGRKEGRQLHFFPA